MNITSSGLKSLHQSLVIKEQLGKMWLAWRQSLPVIYPSKKEMTVISFAPSDCYRIAEIRKTSSKSTYGKVLYSIDMGNEYEIKG